MTLILGFVIQIGALSITVSAGAATGPTFYVNSTSDNSSVSDCEVSSNIDCGVDNAIAAFNIDTTPSDSDNIIFGSSASPFVTNDTAINNSTAGVSLVISGNGSGTTAVSGSGSHTVFTISAGAITISNVTVEDGTVSMGEGGAIHNGGTLTLTNDTITNNSVTNGGVGGGIANTGGTLTLTNDTISNNSATSGGGSGGGIFNSGGTVTATDDTFSNNSATNGGAITSSGGTDILSDNTFFNDSVSGSGGGIFINGSGATLNNDTFFDDVASAGGGVFFNGYALTVSNDTFSNDVATAGGGIDDAASGDTVANSIFDSAGCAGTITDGGHNVESDNSCGFGASDVVNSTTINLGGALAPNDSSGPETLAIGSDSAAFEVVPAVSCTITTDERALPRPGELGQSACDAGAYEYQHAAPPAPQPQSQNISFAPISSVAVTTAPFVLSATATSSLSVSFASTTVSVCAVSSTTVSVLAIGTCSLTASQAGNATFAPAAPVSESFNVTAAELTVPGRPAFSVSSPAKGRLKVTLRTRASGATSYQYSLNGRGWLRISGGGPFTLSRLVHKTDSLRLRGINAAGPGPASNAVRIRIRS